MSEQRIFSKVNLRASGGDGAPMVIEGCAAPFDTKTYIGQGFVERIAPGAFKRCLRATANGKMDPACLYNHDPNFLLGRMSNRTLTAWEVSSGDNAGLNFRCELPDTSYARDLHALISNRSITGCSFGFGCGTGDDEWSYDEGFSDGLGLDSEDDEDEPRMRSKKRVPSRLIRNVSMLTDFGPVTFPAYTKGTSVDARAAELPSTIPAEFRSAIEAMRGIQQPKPIVVEKIVERIVRPSDDDLLHLVL